MDRIGPAGVLVLGPARGRDGDVHFGRTCRPAVKQLDQVAVGDQARRRSDADVYLIRHDEHNRKLPNARREADGIGGNGLEIVPQGGIKKVFLFACRGVDCVDDELTQHERRHISVVLVVLILDIQV